jgi:hypothetical protein
VSPVCGGSGLACDPPGICLVCEAKVAVDGEGNARVHVAEPPQPKARPVRPVRRPAPQPEPAVVVDAAAERQRLGRCPSCARREHECYGDCSCPRPACVDVQKVWARLPELQEMAEANEWEP